MKHLKRYLFHRIQLHEAGRWLAASGEAGADQVAAYCLFRLNRHARLLQRSATKDVLYSLKNQAVRVFYGRGFCTAVSRQTQVFECWHTWRYTSGYEDWCPKCDNTNIYRQTHLYRFRFEIGGCGYSWHQPESLVTWPVNEGEIGDGGEYEAGSSDQANRLSPALLELYTATLYLYLVGQGVKAADLPPRPSFWVALRKDASQLLWPVRQWWWKRIYTPFWWKKREAADLWKNIKLFWRLLRTGYFEQLTRREVDREEYDYLFEEKDDIPF